MQPTTPAVALKFVRILKNALRSYRTDTHRAAAEPQAVRYPQTKYLELCLHKDVYAMFKPYYHQHALSLAKTTPAYSMDAAQQISEIVTSLGTTLPQSITEWLCLDPDAHLFHQMTQFPHDFVRIPDLPNHIAKRHFHGHDVLAVELIFENQGCFVMAASLEDGDNPPVWISSDFYFVTVHGVDSNVGAGCPAQ